MASHPQTKAGLILRPSQTVNAHDPGHMIVFWENEGVRTYRGFRFSPLDLPLEFQNPSRWRRYFLRNDAPGIVHDEASFVRTELRKRPGKLLQLQWPCLTGFAYEPPATGQSDLRYSFDPDGISCHNCVTWATMTVNRICGSPVFPQVRGGRIALALKQFQALGAEISL
jgi:hypothetical protein